MKTKLHFAPRTLHLALCLVLLSTLNATLSTFAQGTAFTYQGRLSSSGTLYSGSAEFQPTLWNAASGGAQLAANNPATLTVSVTNGLFVLPLDFGSNFPGANRWLQLDVRTNAGSFTSLSPRRSLPSQASIMGHRCNVTRPRISGRGERVARRQHVADG